MSDSLVTFLADTVLWTGLLIALVLGLRRPVARLFGAGAAYALWALPMLRLVLPPLTLPAWMNPAPEPASVAPVLPAETLDLATAPAIAAAPAAVPFDWTGPLLGLWLAGVAVFLVRRFWLYFTLRDQLLAEAHPVGEVGAIRLVETPLIRGPVAFGVLDKVVALPEGFMARHDRRGRDLAIAHELQHHRGHDLLVNILVQPLFALHWFNPLGWAGWRALRRDQEAACDARVIARCPRPERLAYAEVIAEFARRSDAAPRPALAAAMACPVLGDKSVIERLRSLSMSDITPRRRMAGRTLLGAALLALPATATIAYAENARQEAPQDAPDAPEPPLPPDAPAAPQPPEAPAAPGWVEDRDVRVEITRTVDDDGKVKVVRRVSHNDGHAMSAEDRAELERELAGLEAELARENREMERELHEELRRELGENGKMHREIRIATRHAADAAARASADAARAVAMAPEVVHACKGDKEPVTTTTDGGKTRIYICDRAIARIRTDAIASARSAIERDRNLSPEQRAEALAGLREAEREHD